MNTLFIHWNPNEIICHLGPLALRWYSTLWLIGLLTAYFCAQYLYKKHGKSSKDFEPLFLYCFVGILAGARLGHCLFYQPDYFLSSGTHIIEMFLPIRKFADGSWHFIGYEGLASHGGTIGLILGLLLYCMKHKMSKLFVLDVVALSTPLTAFCIRMGNLMNSEIIGKVTDVPWAFIFEQVDMQPRHPGQLYEAIAYLLFFPTLWGIWRKRKDLVGTGFYFGLCLVLIFTFRFFIEYTKEIQEAFEAGMPFDMGQLLSIPFIILGVYFIRKGMKTPIHNS